MVWLEELKRIVLSLPFEDFSSKFFIGYIPNGKEERPSNLVHLGEIDISWKIHEVVVAEIRKLVNDSLEKVV